MKGILPIILRSDDPPPGTPRLVFLLWFAARLAGLAGMILGAVLVVAGWVALVLALKPLVGTMLAVVLPVLAYGALLTVFARWLERRSERRAGRLSHDQEESA